MRRNRFSRSPYPDLLLEMAVVRMASLAPVIDADELLRAIGSAAARRVRHAARIVGSVARVAAARRSREPSRRVRNRAGARRMRVEGEVKADAPLAADAADSSSRTARHARRRSARELPELRDFIRGRRAALAGFMEQGAGLALDGDVADASSRATTSTFAI